MKVNLKISYILLTVIILLATLTTTVIAANGETKIIKSNEDYIIYVEGYESTNFSFAFSNANTTEIENLKFYKNWTDEAENNVACLDNEMGVNLTNKIYLWIIDENNNPIVEAREIKLEEALEMEKIKNLNALTARIMTDPSQTDSKTEDVGGVKITRTSGKLLITDPDSENYKYQYSLEKITETSNFQELTTLLNQINGLTLGNTIEKIDTIQEANEKLNNMLETASWNEVENLTIKQPEESKTGDRYGVLLQKLTKDGELVESDIQILECDREESQEKVTETIPVKTTSALPITGEDITLYIILGLVVIIIIAIIVRIVIIKKNGKNEK